MKEGKRSYISGKEISINEKREIISRILADYAENPRHTLTKCARRHLVKISHFYAWIQATGQQTEYKEARNLRQAIEDLTAGEAAASRLIKRMEGGETRTRITVKVTTKAGKISGAITNETFAEILAAAGDSANVEITKTTEEITPSDAILKDFFNS